MAEGVERVLDQDTSNWGILMGGGEDEKKLLKAGGYLLGPSVI